ncbi:unnamed protein product [Rotaria sordida]|uniref:Uncharacterized protein n=1 Tax=Rotaria sordida TaxID=392033 RepID=A0A819WLD8_9BILA|nr:unnamed protein product [Rotaria sordida]CAF1523750.1 unnamed protein product [Rotaria sordida]CAF4126469.1 unnamed protein product [Rotaria sordida]CAF4150945.1 unnamed protein product [Rotaria sordida]
MGDYTSSDSIRTVKLYDSDISFGIHSTSANAEDLIIVWLEFNQEWVFKEYLQISSYVSSIADVFKLFSDIDKCIDFISSLVHEKVFFIIPLNGAQHFVSLIHDLPQLTYIYIYAELEEEDVCNNQLNWINAFPRVRDGIHNFNSNLFDQIRQDVTTVRSRSVPFTLYWTNQSKNNSIRDLDKGESSYRWSQLLLNALRKLSQNDKSKEDFLNECKVQYRNNESELGKIEEFEKTYQPHLAIWWALWTEDIDIVFKFRFFITDLYNQLTELHNESKSGNSNMLTVYRGQQLAARKYDQAIKSYETGLEIDQETLPIDHPSSASSHINIGHAYDMNGKYDVALDHYKKAHDILINRGTIGRTKLATVLGNMGVIHSKKYEYGLALDCQKKCLEIRKQFCPAFSKDIAITYSNIAVVYAKMKSTAKAIEYQQKAIEIVRGSQIPNDPVLALLYNNMGKNYADLGNTERALYYYNLSLDIKYSYLPPNHPTIGVTFSNIAIMLIASGDLKMALHYFEKALQIFVQSFGVDHPIRVGCVEDMALLRTVMDISEY